MLCSPAPFYVFNLLFSFESLVINAMQMHGVLFML